MNRLLYEEIVQKIEEQIYKGSLEDGDKLPSERELAEEFAVSRNVIREAIGTLREKGFIVVRQGKGAYVTKQNNGVVTETLSRMLRGDDSTGEDILEVREALEIAIIRKAVHKASPANIEMLKSIYGKMEDKKQYVNQFIEEDAGFHRTLAEATQNRIFPLLIDSFYELTEGSIFSLTQLTPYSVDDAQNHHWDLIKAIEGGDEESAVSTIQGHIELLRKEVAVLKKGRKVP
ncbi:MAG TPA: FadR/GntR family transcriptional regulator [Bacillales bacterium]|nr:FadR/GntR family transcriptional regulator [Bacillales bacterium]